MLKKKKRHDLATKQQHFSERFLPAYCSFDQQIKSYFSFFGHIYNCCDFRGRGWGPVKRVNGVSSGTQWLCLPSISVWHQDSKLYCSTTAWCYKEQNEKCGCFIDVPALWIWLGYSWFYLDGVILKFVLAMKLPFAISHVPKGFPSGSVVKNLPANAGCPAGDVVQSWVGKIPWRRKWQPTPVFLPGKSHGQRSLEGYSSWGCKRVSRSLPRT